MTKDNINFLISFQAFDKDSHSDNLYVLMDRIGIYAYTGEYSAIDAQTNMIVTNIDLPLSKDDMDELADIIDRLCQNDYLKLKASYEIIKQEIQELMKSK